MKEDLGYLGFMEAGEVEQAMEIPGEYEAIQASLQTPTEVLTDMFDSAVEIAGFFADLI